MNNRRMLWDAALATLLTGTLRAQDISGDWQGTLKAGPQELRTILQITKADGGWKATMYSIDQGADPISVSAVTLEGSTFKYKVDALRGSYEGKLSADGASIDGSWTQGRPQPLKLERATKQTAWKIDQGSHTVQSHNRQNKRREAGGAGLGRHGAAAGAADRAGKRRACVR